MNVKWKPSHLTIGVVSLLVCFAAVAQQGSSPTLTATNDNASRIVRIEDIRKTPPLLEKRTIEGLVIQHVDSSERTTHFYIVKDDYGSVIRVLTSHGLPEVNAKYRITGIISKDAKRKHLYIDEQSRTLLKRPLDARRDIDQVAPAGAPYVASPDTARERPTPDSEVTEELIQESGAFQSVRAGVVAHPFISGVILLLGLTFFGTLIGTTWLVVSRNKAPVTNVTAQSPAPAATAEGSTIKIHTPPPGTLKLLPGRLEVISGDDTIRELRFYKSPGQTTPEISFGRATGAPYRHVQLKPMTVSAQQARLTYFDGSWALTNLAKASSNPTLLNGREMGLGEAVRLANSDEIAMGEVVFRFHES